MDPDSEFEAINSASSNGKTKRKLKSGASSDSLQAFIDREETDVKIIHGLEPKKNVDVNFMIENSGSNLSNGERQIINFYRVVLRDVEIVCLDEASS